MMRGRPRWAMPDIDTDKAMSAVEKVTKVSKRKFPGSDRTWPVVEARMLLTLLLYRRGMVDRQIAWIIKRERITVSRSRLRAIALLETSKVFREKFEKIKDVNIKPDCNQKI